MKKLLVAIAVLALLSAVAFGQTKGADIYGTVVLPDGSAIPGVAVTLTGDVTGTKTTVTSEEGNFRFLQLPPGNYQLKFELEGFKTVINKGIRLYVGKNKNLSVQMETSTIKEEIVITGKTGAVDVRKTTVGVNITNEMLTSLPTARNPWTILNLVPGMMIDREDVGGNESGQQSSFYGLGASSDDTTWNVDGANITDPSAIGAAPNYMNTNSYEEMQVTMGANDIGAQTGGTQLNFVTKRGGNRYSGDFHLYVEDEAWEMTQTLPDSITNKGWGSPGVYRLYQYGVNFGGPVMKDKLWFFGSYAVQDIHSRTIAQTEDTTWLRGMYGKFDFQFGNTSGMFQYNNDNKQKWGRTAIGAANQAVETTFDQSGPGGTYLASLQHVMSNLMLNVKFAYQDGGFTLDPKANADGWMYKQNDGVVGPDWYYYQTPSVYWTGGCYLYLTNRNSINLSMDGNYFAEGVLGGDHEIRFGVDYYTADTTTQEYYPNHRELVIEDRNNPAGYKEIWWVADYIFDVGFKRVSFYLSDTATFGKLTANIGLRYDKETGSHNPVVAPGLLFNGTTPIFTSYLGDLSVPGGSVDAAYEVISPRISLTYDITGDGKNVVKASFARYGGQSGNDIASHTVAAPWREVDVYWDDLNGDLKPQIGEWSENPADWVWWSIDIYDPYAVKSPNKFDPDFNSPILTELTLAFEKALGEDLAVAVNLFYKKTTNLRWYRGLFTVDMTGAPSGLSYNAGDLETAANWYQKGTYTFLDGSSKPYYERYYVPNASYLTNYDSGTYTLYQALQLIFSKKLAGGWMLDASFTYADWTYHYDEATYFDKTNFEYYQDGANAPQSGGSGITGIYVNSRWQFKLSGLYQLPWGINITGVLQAREGYVVPYYERYRRGSGLGWTNMLEPGKKFGDDRLPTFWMLNLGLEKSFKVSDTTTCTLFCDGYNITNNTTTLKVNPILGSAAGDIERILNPGLFQFGVRVSF
jgi:hypothetical protein